VIVEHVDTKSGSDAFYRLRDVEPGDKVRVHDAFGDVTLLVVDTKNQEPKNELPMERTWL